GKGLVAVKQGSTVLVSYTLDALRRRATENAGTLRDLYYSAQWQVIEERESGVVRVQTVFSPVYVDGLILRDRDADGLSGNGLEERLWVQQDANWNVSALTNGAGNVVERFVYDPYGAVSVWTPGWATRTESLYAWKDLFQGLRLDSTARLYHARNRELSPSQARFLQRDPQGLSAGDPNFYRVVRNSPVNATDPSGQF